MFTNFEIKLESKVLTERELLELTICCDYQDLKKYYILCKLKSFLQKNKEVFKPNDLQINFYNIIDYASILLNEYRCRSDYKIFIERTLENSLQIKQKYLYDTNKIKLYSNYIVFYQLIFVLHLHFDEIIYALINKIFPYELRNKNLQIDDKTWTNYHIQASSTSQTWTTFNINYTQTDVNNVNELVFAV